MFELKKYRGVYLMAWWLMQNFKENSFVLSKMNLSNFGSWLKNNDFILESKMAGIIQNKNSKQTDRPDAVWKFYFTLEINEQHN